MIHNAFIYMVYIYACLSSSILLDHSLSMPTKTMTYSKEKPVLLKVYAENPRKNRLSQSQHQHHHQHHHHHHLHQTIRREVILYDVNGTSSTSKGYDRRAQLLQYSRHLQLSARSASKSPFQSSSSVNHKLTSQTTTVAVPRKPKQPKTPGCFGNWKMLLPNFFRTLTGSKGKKEREERKHSGSASNKIKAIKKSLQIQKKKRGFISGCINSTVGMR